MDSHTLLANKVFELCFSQGGARKPAILSRHGYAVHSIEPNVRVKNRNVRPDIILVSTRHSHALVIDCKSGANIDLGQDRIYGQMAIGDLWKIGVPTSIRSHTPIYAINEEHVSRIRGHTDHPLIVFEGNSILGLGSVGDMELMRELRAGISRERGAELDTKIYPFSIRDSLADIDAHVEGAIGRYVAANPGMAGKSLATRAAASAVLRHAHPLYDFLSRPHRIELRRAVTASISRQERLGAWWLGPAARAGRIRAR